MFSYLYANNYQGATNLEADGVVDVVNNWVMLGHTWVGKFIDLVYLQNDC